MTHFYDQTFGVEDATRDELDEIARSQGGVVGSIGGGYACRGRVPTMVHDYCVSWRNTRGVGNCGVLIITPASDRARAVVAEATKQWATLSMRQIAALMCATPLDRSQRESLPLRRYAAERLSAMPWGRQADGCFVRHYSRATELCIPGGTWVVCTLLEGIDVEWRSEDAARAERQAQRAERRREQDVYLRLLEWAAQRLLGGGTLEYRDGEQGGCLVVPMGAHDRCISAPAVIRRLPWWVAPLPEGDGIYSVGGDSPRTSPPLSGAHGALDAIKEY